MQESEKRSPLWSSETGVREYWIVDLDRETVTIYETERWEVPSCHSFSERIQTGICKDLYLDFTEFSKG